MNNTYNERERTRWTRAEIAELLGVTPPRVSQIASYMGLKVSRNRRGEEGYTIYQVTKMRKRNTKPGPEGKRKK